MLRWWVSRFRISDRCRSWFAESFQNGFFPTYSLINVLTLVGLATDYCVAYSALDAATQGFSVTVLEEACRAIDLAGSLARQRQAMAAVGVMLVG